MTEIWKDIYGYEGYYQVSNLGNIRSLDRYIKVGKGIRFFKGTTLKTWLSHNGYVLCNLKKMGKTQTVRVNRLVAIAFLDNPLNYPQVNHKNFDKKDNSVNNLEWCDERYNINYTYKNKTTRSQKKVLQIDKNTNEILAVYPSLAEAGRAIGGIYQNISRCCHGNAKTHRGYKWRFVDD